MMDTALRQAFDAIVKRDAEGLARMLENNPALATAALQEGASRADAAPSFYEEIRHYVYRGDTALHVAAAAHWLEGVRLLLRAGASHAARNRHRQSPLHYACAGGPGLPGWNPDAQAQAIQALLDAGADVNARAMGEVTSLHTAVRNRCSRAVETLLRGGADRSLGNKRGSTPAHLATVTSGRGQTGSAEAKAEQAKIVAMLASR
ncbi:MAG: ankyrin repeat domain-containing protein [Acidobacteriota bacterium]